MAKVLKKDQAIEVEAEAIAGGESIDQIREILFGTAQREHQSRMERIESQIARNAVEIGERLGSLEEMLLKRLDNMTRDFGARTDQLAETARKAEAELHDDLRATAVEINDRITESDTRASSDLQAQSDSLKDDISSLRAELRDAVRRLEDEKTDRLDLGGHLIEIGRRLSGHEISLTQDIGIERPAKAKSDAKA